MKTLVLILLAFFCVQSARPCDDFESTDGNNINITKVFSQQNAHQAGDEHKDDCSPLCMCSCCHSHILISYENLNTGIEITSPAETTKHYDLLQRHSYKIPRPPRA